MIDHLAVLFMEVYVQVVSCATNPQNLADSSHFVLFVDTGTSVPPIYRCKT